MTALVFCALYDSKNEVLPYQRQKYSSVVVVVFSFLSPGDVVIARLSKIQKKKRCIFTMATVSKEQAYMRFSLSVVMRNSTER